MAVFSGLSDKLNHIFAKMTKRGKLDDIDEFNTEEFVDGIL